MKQLGVLKKMRTKIVDKSIQYVIELKDNFFILNTLLGKSISLTFKGYQCLNCGSEKPVFRQGFCKSCFFESPNVGEWIIRPELSQAHLNIEDRDLNFEKKIQLQPHIVYLAYSGNLKIGVTRESQTPTRFIDQGATVALPFLNPPNRYLAGITEVALKNYLDDKTAWRKMLTNTATIDNQMLINKVKEIEPYIPQKARSFLIDDYQNRILTLNFPLKKQPIAPKSLNLIKQENYTGVFVGVKGQYLIFEDDTVFNIRSNEGLFIEFSINS